MSLEEAKERSKLVWGTGDYGPTSDQLEQASDALVDALGVAAGQRVLDVAAGHGNCALAAARRSAKVCASDFSPPMIEVGRARTAAEGLEVEWREADAADLPFEDGAFDRVTSVFGAIFAPEQETVASELVRVTRQGGLVGLTAWTPDGFVARLLGIGRSYGPPGPEDAPDPLRWGEPEEVAAMFAASGCAADIRKRAVTFRYSSWEQCREAFEVHGSSVIAKRRMPPDAYEEMIQRIRELVGEYNHADGDEGEVAYDADYLEVLVARA